ncbi:MAG: DUF2461 domain-containing protein [Silicimonas sp.]|nr:DUF2461 domain-containing protein [Silicimonas sp.]
MAFTRETFDFLRDLSRNNSKDWFDANRDRYEAHWKAAALDFIADISADMAALSPPLAAQPKLNGSLRRINRDVRFSKDKSPYTARLHMIFWAGGHPNRSPGLHIVLNPSGVGYGAGQFGFEPAQLRAIRDRIVDPADGDALIAALASAERVGCVMGEPDLARLPKGYDASGKRAELLRHKAIVARTFDADASSDVLIGTKARDWVMRTSGALIPLIRWLSTA